jgi:hypothetical protein
MPDPASDAPPARFFLILFQSGLFYDRFGTLNYPVLHKVREKLDIAVETAPEVTEIDLWLESFGGDAHAAYRIFLDLQYRCRKLRVVIPDIAKSAATLLALGTDEIYMAPSAELGPLDAQIEHPDREGVTVSALDVSKALGFLGDFALDYVVKGGKAILGSTGLPRAEVLREFSAFAARFLEPVMTKFDPHLVHRAANQLAVAHHYATKMLNLRRLSDEDKRRKCNTNELVKRLVEDYPAHECVISRDEARDLPLPIKDAEDYDRWVAVKAVCSVYNEGEFSTDESHSFIKVMSDVELGDFLKALNPEDEESPTAQPEGDPHESHTNLQSKDGKPPEVPQTVEEGPVS